MTLRKTAVIGSALVALVGLLSFPRLLLGSDHARAKELIQQACVQCHRLEGKAESRFNLRAPDLIWGREQISTPLAGSLADGERGRRFMRKAIGGISVRER